MDLLDKNMHFSDMLCLYLTADIGDFWNTNTKISSFSIMVKTIELASNFFGGILLWQMKPFIGLL